MSEKSAPGVRRRLATLVFVVILFGVGILVSSFGNVLYEFITYERESIPEYGGGRLDILRNRWCWWGDHEIWRISTRSRRVVFEDRRPTKRSGAIGLAVTIDGSIEINSSRIRRTRVEFDGLGGVTIVFPPD